MKKYLRMLIHAFLPERCAYCGKVISDNLMMCSDCEKSVARIKGIICKKCGRQKDDCTCKNNEMYFDGLVAPFYFEGVVRSGIHRFKFRKFPDNSKAYSFEMAKTVEERLNGINFDFISEIPVSKKRIKERGYNQCYLLAKEISQILQIEHKPDLFVKLYETDNQHGLPYYLRKGNLSGVFDVTNPDEVTDKTILLCDDISTSGETFNECAKMLWLYGAKEIYCVSVALTKQKKSEKW